MQQIKEKQIRIMDFLESLGKMWGEDVEKGDNLLGTQTVKFYCNKMSL